MNIAVGINEIFDVKLAVIMGFSLEIEDSVALKQNNIQNYFFYVYS